MENKRHLIFLTLCWLYGCVFCESLTISSRCPPAEEGKETTLTFQLNNYQEFKNTEVFIKKDETNVAVCKICHQCKALLLPIPSKTYINGETNSSVTMIRLKIFPTLRTHEGSWSLTHPSFKHTCNLLIFHKPDNVFCTSYYTWKEFSITCKASLIYPAAKSLVSINTQKQLININADCFSKELQGVIMYYSSDCLLAIPAQRLFPGFLEAHVTIYPNVTNSDLDIGFGENISYRFYIDYPSVIFRDCPEVVAENTEVTCTCERSDSERFKGHVEWFDNSSDQNVGNNGSHVLHFNAIINSDMEQRHYICKALIVPEWENSKSTAVYSPWVIAKITNIDCTQNILTWSVIVTCTSEHKYPLANCYFVINNYKIVLNNTFSYYTETIKDEKKHFKYVCTANIPKALLRTVLQEVSITMYPNVSDDKTDIQFGRSLSVKLSIDYPSVILRDCPEAVVENTEVTCTCDRTDSRLFKGQVDWFDNSSGQNVGNNGSNVLHFNAIIKGYVEKRRYICKAITVPDLENSNSTAVYSPWIIAKTTNIDCNQSILKWSVIVTCTGEHKYPLANCSFVKKNTQVVLNNTFSYNTETIKDEQMHYKYVCTANIPKSLLITGLQEVSITMYPNVSNDDSDIQFGRFISVNLSIGEAANFSKTSDTDLLMFVLFGNVCILTIFIAICWFQFKAKQLRVDNYDEIGDVYALAGMNLNQGGLQYVNSPYLSIQTIRRQESQFHVDYHEYESI